MPIYHIVEGSTTLTLRVPENVGCDEGSNSLTLQILTEKQYYDFYTQYQKINVNLNNVNLIAK